MHYVVMHEDDRSVVAWLHLNPFMNPDAWYARQVEVREELKRDYPERDIQLGIIDSPE